jgi:hypothetical protein
MYKNFEQYILGILGLYGGSWDYMVKSLTDKLLKLIVKPNLSEIAQMDINKLQIGKFYLIQYNFNGNLIWCPILTLDYKVIKNKHILYALNLEYLPPKYKSIFFSNILKNAPEMLDSISQSSNAITEQKIDFFNFETIYKLLKINNMHYAISAYTIKDFLGNIKIKKCYACSIKILPEIIMADLKKLNMLNMSEIYKTLMGEEQSKMGDIIKNYNTLIEEYQSDSILYHKKVALFRENLKIYKDI